MGITLFHCKKNGPKLKDHAIHFNNMNVDHCEIWFKKKEILSGFQNRPKSLKVFVNPTSHKKEAYQIYRDYVAPLFQLADIKADVTITERKGARFIHSVQNLTWMNMMGFTDTVTCAVHGHMAPCYHCNAHHHGR
ncbi:ceramide kinase-like protein isoform X2 [Salmo trutta]|uniref:ceramide kinase-like protein isoform X2 n=1 Tax=Salmo trutta TaxID=8032 RepID=UPI001131B0B2|nr:ceramide kinase-like protein isoform X2 [Salmo trutta]